MLEECCSHLSPGRCLILAPHRKVRICLVSRHLSELYDDVVLVLLVQQIESIVS